MENNYVRLIATDSFGHAYEGLAVSINTDHHETLHKNFALLQDCGKFRMGNYSCFPARDTKTIPLTKEQREIADSLYSKFQELHRTSPYRIIGRLYEETPFFYSWDTRKEYPSYNEVPRSEMEWELDAKDVSSINEASEWLLKNHPDYWMGSNIIQECPSGNFSMHAVPCVEYGKGNYESYAARYRFAENEAKRRGVRVGKSEVIKEEE